MCEFRHRLGAGSRTELLRLRRIPALTSGLGRDSLLSRNTTEQSRRSSKFMDPVQERLRNLSRRHFFKQSGLAAGRIALAGMLWPEMSRAAAAGGTRGGMTIGKAHPALPGLPHFAPKTKRLI